MGGWEEGGVRPASVEIDGRLGGHWVGCGVVGGRWAGDRSHAKAASAGPPNRMRAFSFISFCNSTMDVGLGRSHHYTQLSCLTNLICILYI